MYSEKIKAAIIGEYHSGAQVVSLSEIYGVSQSTIYSWTSKSVTLPSSKYAKKPAVRQKDYEDLRRHSQKLEQIVSACSRHTPGKTTWATPSSMWTTATPAQTLLR